jgi:hypothetical protein
MTCVYDGCYREVCPHILGYEELGLERALVFNSAATARQKSYRVMAHGAASMSAR